MKKLYLLLLVLFLSITSCKEDQEDPTPQPELPAPEPEPEVKEVNFNFRYDPISEGTETIELIVSQKDSAILLDTLIAARTNHKLMVKSSDTKFNISTVYSSPTSNWYYIKTYIQVDPNNWHIDEGADRHISGKTEEATIHYTNVPQDWDQYIEFEFGSKESPARGGSYRYGNLDLHYYRLLPADLTYLLLPNSGKYIFAEVTSPDTHVDFSKAETAVRLTYDKPEGVTNFRSELLGFLEAGDYSESIDLFSPVIQPTDYDLLYPLTRIKEFQLKLSYQDTEDYKYSYLSLGETVPTEIEFLPKSDFTVINSEVSNVEVSFGEDKPSTYTMTFLSKNANINARWQVFLPPEEKAFKAFDFIKNLNAVSLEGEDLSSFTLSNVITRKAKGYTHQSMHDYLNNPEAYKRKELKQYREIYKTF